MESHGRKFIARFKWAPGYFPVSWRIVCAHAALVHPPPLAYYAKSRLLFQENIQIAVIYKALPSVRVYAPDRRRKTFGRLLHYYAYIHI